jgi:hypothetical protein
MPALKALFEWVDTFPTGIEMRESANWFPALLTVHLISMCLFAGLIVMMDLRLMGIGNKETPFTEIQKRLFPWQILGISISAISGLMLVYMQPMRYYFNVFFWVKVMMMFLAGLNAMAFHSGTYNYVANWDRSTRMPFGAKLAALVSLAMWAGVVMCGRLIAYNWFNPTP